MNIFTATFESARKREEGPARSKAAGRYQCSEVCTCNLAMQQVDNRDHSPSLNMATPFRLRRDSSLAIQNDFESLNIAQS